MSSATGHVEESRPRDKPPLLEKLHPADLDRTLMTLAGSWAKSQNRVEDHDLAGALGQRVSLPLLLDSFERLLRPEDEGKGGTSGTGRNNELDRPLLDLFIIIFETAARRSQTHSPSPATNLASASENSAHAPRMSEERWMRALRFLLSLLELPSYFSDLSNVRIYDDKAWADVQPTLKAFHAAAAGWLDILGSWLSIIASAAHTTKADSISPNRTSGSGTHAFNHDAVPGSRPGRLIYEIDADAAEAEAGRIALRHLAAECVLGVARYDMPPDLCEWVTAATRSKARALLVRLAGILPQGSGSEPSAASAGQVDSKLPGDQAQSDQHHVQRLLTHLLPRLLRALRPLMRAGETGDAWKQRPDPRHLVRYVVTQIPHPALGPQLGDVLPMVLPLVHDHLIPNKTIGLQTLLYIVRNVNPTELRWHKLPVMQELRAALAFRDEPLVELYLPAITDAMMMVYTRPTAPLALPAGPGSGGVSLLAAQRAQEEAESQDRDHEECSEVLQQLLSELDYLVLSPSRDKLAVTQVYVEGMIRLSVWLGVSLVQHLARVLPIVLALCQRSEHRLRQLALLWLATLMQVCWPRVSAHRLKLLDSLLDVYLQLAQEETLDRPVFGLDLEPRTAGHDPSHDDDDSHLEDKDEDDYDDRVRDVRLQKWREMNRVEVKRSRGLVLECARILASLSGPDFKVTLRQLTEGLPELRDFEAAFASKEI